MFFSLRNKLNAQRLTDKEMELVEELEALKTELALRTRDVQDRKRELERLRNELEELRGESTHQRTIIIDLQ